MHGAFPAPPVLWTFLVASLVLAVAPGPGVLYIVARSVAQGRRAGLASAAGVALGNLGNVLVASVGLAVLFSASPRAFAAVRWSGAAYLVFLGWQAWRSPAPPASASNTAKAASARRLFRDGAWVALLNPKTALFFGAFLPQFIGGSHPAEGASAALTVTLGGLFIVIAAVTDSLYALVAGKLRPLLEGASRSRRFGARLSGSVLIGLGLFTAYSGTSSP